MSGKQHKRELKRQKELAREQARREERRRTLFTLVVIAVVVAIGGVLIALSMNEGEEVAEAPTPTPEAVDAEPCEPAPAPEGAGAEKPTFDAAPEQALAAGADYRATIETSCGRVVVDLYEDRAPQTVSNFVFLAEQGFYDGLKIFRNAPSIFALQTGAGTDEASFQVGYTFPDELTAAEEEGYTAGSLAMANSGPDTNGSQFFFVYGDSSLPPQYTKFGQVVEGLEVLESIGAIPVDGETPTKDVYLERVTIETLQGTTPTEPTANPTEPTANPTEPTANPTEPSATPTEEAS